jgi:hypothetical protein
MVILDVHKHVVRLVSSLTYTLLFFSVITKLFCIPYISEKFHILGIADYCQLFGVIELISIVLFAYARTMGIGIIMLCSYFGGAIATDVQSPNYLYQPFVVLGLVLISTFLKKPSFFHDGFRIEKGERVRIFLE